MFFSCLGVTVGQGRQAADQCTDCEARYLAGQWCSDCSRPCQRLGPGGYCPCGELLTVDELLSSS
jgi:hypothetical protein